MNTFIRFVQSENAFWLLPGLFFYRSPRWMLTISWLWWAIEIGQE